MLAIIRKELADYVTSIRFVAFLLLMIVVSVTGLMAASQGCLLYTSDAADE